MTAMEDLFFIMKTLKENNEAQNLHQASLTVFEDGHPITRLYFDYGNLTGNKLERMEYFEHKRNIEKEIFFTFSITNPKLDTKAELFFKIVKGFSNLTLYGSDEELGKGAASFVISLHRKIDRKLEHSLGLLYLTKDIPKSWEQIKDNFDIIKADDDWIRTKATAEDFDPERPRFRQKHYSVFMLKRKI